MKNIKLYGPAFIFHIIICIVLITLDAVSTNPGMLGILAAVILIGSLYTVAATKEFVLMLGIGLIITMTSPFFNAFLFPVFLVYLALVSAYVALYKIITHP